MSLHQSMFFSSIPSPFSQSTPLKFPKPDTIKIQPSQTGFPSFMTDPDQMEKQQQKAEQNIPENILVIVSKSTSERTGSQNSLIMKYLLKRGIFKFLRNKLSYDIVKTIIRQGSLKLYGNGEVLTSEGRKVKSVDILLFGEVYSISQLEKQTEENQDQNQQKNIEEKLDLLIQKLGRQSRKFKLKSNPKNTSDTERFRLSRKESIRDEINLSGCEHLIPECFIDFDPLFRYEPKHSKTAFAKQAAVIFSISLEKFYQCLLHIYHTRLNEKIKIFRTISIFDPFENSKLRSLVQKLEKIEVRKDQYVYRQGEQSLCFYMLIEGEIQVSKTIDILRQNPNNFYKNRVQVSKQKLNSNIKILPYANFHGVYNYFPEKKKITLAKINPTCIFGEEEILDGKKRQVNAKVLSLTAKIYQIHLEDIEQLCSKMIGSNGQKKMALIDFLMIMEQSVTLKKILFRQNHLSDLVNYENKSKYGTLFEDQKQKRRNNFRKNISQKRANSQQKISMQFLQRQQQAPPVFNNFNFTEFIKGNQQAISTIPNQFNEQQLKIVKLTHVKYQNQDKKNKEKSLRFRSFSRDITSRTKITIENYATIDSESNLTTKKIQPTLGQKITLEQPLFTMNYFLKQERAERRLYAQAKKKKLESIYKLSPERQH